MRYLMILLVLVLMLGVSCKNSSVTEDTGLLKSLDAADCPTATIDACCHDLCVQFCKDNGQTYTKHVVNGEVCPCWCD